MFDTNHYDYWLGKNRNALEYLFKELINISSSYGINIYDDDESAENFIKMMYCESNGGVINKRDFPEYFR